MTDEDEKRWRVRVQPSELPVPEDDPFRHDLLGRREAVEVLSELLSHIEGPCVLALDAPWGTGKTSFLRMWSAHLRGVGFRVAEFNAWETDFTGEPFAALTAELGRTLTRQAGSRFEKALSGTRAAAVQVLKYTVPGAIRLATAGALDLDPLIEGEFGSGLAALAQEHLQRYEQARKSIESFRTELSELAEEVAADSAGHPLVIFVDELDRCRPSYAVELLEVAKHLFSVDNIIFVVSIDRMELAHSIRAIYGSGFDASGYLRRFFDVDYALPVPDRTGFVQSLLQGTSIEGYFDRTKDQEARQLREVVGKMITSLLGQSSVGLRPIAQGVGRLALMLGSLPADKRMFATTVATLVVLRTLDPTLYQDLVSGKKSDAEVLDLVFGDPALRPLRGEHPAKLFEATIMAGVAELGRPSARKERLTSLADQDPPPGEDDPLEVIHAKELLDYLPQLARNGFDGNVGFRYSIRRLELLSPAFIGAREHL